MTSTETENLASRLVTIALLRRYGSPSNVDAVRYSVPPTQLGLLSNAGLRGHVERTVRSELADSGRDIDEAVVNRLLADAADAAAANPEIGPEPTPQGETS